MGMSMPPGMGTWVRVAASDTEAAPSRSAHTAPLPSWTSERTSSKSPEKAGASAGGTISPRPDGATTGFRKVRTRTRATAMEGGSGEPRDRTGRATGGGVGGGSARSAGGRRGAGRWKANCQDTTGIAAHSGRHIRSARARIGAAGAEAGCSLVPARGAGVDLLAHGARMIAVERHFHRRCERFGPAVGRQHAGPHQLQGHPMAPAGSEDGEQAGQPAGFLEESPHGTTYAIATRPQVGAEALRRPPDFQRFGKGRPRSSNDWESSSRRTTKYAKGAKQLDRRMDVFISCNSRVS